MKYNEEEGEEQGERIREGGKEITLHSLVRLEKRKVDIIQNRNAPEWRALSKRAR